MHEIGFMYQNIKDIFAVTYLCLHLSIVHIISNVNNSNKDKSIIKTEEYLNVVLELLYILHKQFNEVICYISLL